MFPKRFKILMPIILIAIELRRGEGTKCGDFTCEGKSECKYSKERDKLECACEQGFVANVTGTIYYCREPANCLKIGDKCGPEHICNVDLVCEKTKVVDVENCPAGEEKCLQRCCHTGELCFDGKCITRPPTLDTECPEALQCLGHCCAANELCSAENVCVLAKEASDSAVGVEENEVCENGTNCMPAIGQCPESLKCGDQCCGANEKCQNESQCITKDYADEECPPAQICLNKCCNKTEKCSKENVCVAKEKLDSENSLECPLNRTCGGVCCAENEICREDRECVSHVPLKSECPQSRTCLDKCCPLNQVCSKEHKCAHESSYTDAVSSTFFTSSAVPIECPIQKQCLGTCCKEEEKCSQFNVCIPINTIECIETEICGDKCCPINEICNEGHECVSFVELAAVENCPAKQKCLDKCCKPQEVCNKLDKCVARIVKKELLNYDIGDELPATESSFDATVHLTNLKSHQPTINCSADYFVCANKCCHRKQTCSPAGVCLDNIEANLKANDCEREHNCAGDENAVETEMSLAYAVIGVGCLVMVLSFGLFKVHAFRRSNRVLY